MLQKKAWMFLAKSWDEPVKCRHNDCMSTFINCPAKDPNEDGICLSIEAMFNTKLISDQTRGRMLSKIARAKARAGLNDSSYLFPMDIHGARQRAAFCRRMARACK